MEIDEGLIERVQTAALEEHGLGLTTPEAADVVRRAALGELTGPLAQTVSAQISRGDGASGPLGGLGGDDTAAKSGGDRVSALQAKILKELDRSISDESANAALRRAESGHPASTNIDRCAHAILGLPTGPAQAPVSTRTGRRRDRSIELWGLAFAAGFVALVIFFDYQSKEVVREQECANASPSTFEILEAPSGYTFTTPSECVYPLVPMLTIIFILVALGALAAAMASRYRSRRAYH